MSLVAGIDLSTHAIDVVTVPLEGPGTPVWHRFPLTGANSFDRARAVRDAMPARTSELWDDCLAVGVEDPRGFSAGVIYRVQGAVLACLPVQVLVHPWIPSEWRRRCGVKKSGGNWKDAARDYAEHNGAPMEWADDNAYDAYCIALATRSAIEIGVAA